MSEMTMPPWNGKRSAIEIIGEILELRECSKTGIMYKVNMSYALLQKYLSFLLSRGLLEQHTNGKGRITYRITPRGEELLRNIHYLQEQLELV